MKKNARYRCQYCHLGDIRDEVCVGGGRDLGFAHVERPEGQLELIKSRFSVRAKKEQRTALDIHRVYGCAPPKERWYPSYLQNHVVSNCHFCEINEVARKSGWKSRNGATAVERGASTAVAVDPKPTGILLPVLGRCQGLA